MPQSSYTILLLMLPTIVLGPLGHAADPPPSNEVQLLGVERIWDGGGHNAFTDLIRFQDRWYCAFREAKGHVKGNGRIRVITSQDGVAWRASALLEEEGIDLRDPKFCVAPDNRLMLTLGGSLYDGDTLLGRQPRVAFSQDGAAWTAPERVLTEGEWLWRVTWHNDTAYGVSYNSTTEPDWTITLFKSDDGRHYEKVTVLDVPGKPNETTLRFLENGSMVALVRREGDNKMAWIGTSVVPFTDWTWSETGHQVGGPNFIVLPDGAMWGGGRSYPGGAKTVLARMTKNAYEPVFTLPSGGDTSYPGFVWHEKVLWMSYYASHEDKTSIYLARFAL